MIRLIDTKLGKNLYRELLKIYIIEFKEFPTNCPNEFKEELIELVNKEEKTKK